MSNEHGHRVSGPISKKKKFVKDGVFYAELNDILAHEFADNGYAGCEVRVTPKSTEVYIRATHTKEVAGENNRRIREMRALIEKRFNFKPGRLNVYTAAVQNKGLSALAQAQAVKYRLLQGFSVRLAAYSVVKLIMDQRGAKGCEVVVSGKLRGQRAKAMKFRQGYMIHAGDAKNYYVEKAVKHVHLRQGVIGIKVKIMLPHDPTGEMGVKRELPDTVVIKDPKEEPVVIPESVQDNEEVEDNIEDVDADQASDVAAGAPNQDHMHAQDAQNQDFVDPQNVGGAGVQPQQMQDGANYGNRPQVGNDPAYMGMQQQQAQAPRPNMGMGGVPRGGAPNYGGNFNGGNYM